MSPEETTRQNKINPAIQRFVASMDKEGLKCSALIFDPDGGFLIKAGNVEHQGEAFVRLHYLLALVVARLDAAGHCSVSEQSTPNQASLSRSPEEIADRLTVSLLSMPTELLPDRIVDLAQEYADARKDG